MKCYECWKEIEGKPEVNDTPEGYSVFVCKKHKVKVNIFGEKIK